MAEYVRPGQVMLLNSLLKQNSHSLLEGRYLIAFDAKCGLCV